MAETDEQTVRERLIERKREMEDAGTWMGQNELAARLGIGEPAVSQWFTGAKEPDVGRYLPLAAILGVNAAWLAWGSGPKFPDGGSDAMAVTRRRPRAQVSPRPRDGHGRADA